GGEVSRCLPSGGGHHADLALPAAPALEATLAALPAGARRAVCEPEPLVERAPRARSSRRPPQPPGGGGGARARGPQVALLDRALSRGRVLAALQRRGLSRGEGDLRPRRSPAGPLPEGPRMRGMRR